MARGVTGLEDDGSKEMKSREDAQEAEGEANFSGLVASQRERSAERLEQRRRRAKEIALEQQEQWKRGIVLLDKQARPILARALQACVEDQIPAVLTDNFGDEAVTPRLFFHCEGADTIHEGQQIPGPVSQTMIVQSDGDCIRVGTAKTYSTYPDNMQAYEDLEEALTDMFSAIPESYFQSCEQVEARSFGD